MKKPNITGRDGYIIAQALAYASEWLKSVGDDWDEPSNRSDMNALLRHIAPGMGTLFREQAQNILQDRRFADVEDVEQPLCEAAFQVVTGETLMEEGVMFCITMPPKFKVGDTVEVEINGEPKKVTWRDRETLVIEPGDVRDIVSHGLMSCPDLRVFICSDARAKT